jgi:hypothetical protein
VLGATPAHALDLTGQSVCATWGSTAWNGDRGTSTPFACPSIVGPGTEFLGSFVDVFQQEWLFAVGVFSTGSSLVVEQPVGNGNVSSISAFSWSLTGRSGIGPVSLESYTCEPEGVVTCEQVPWPPSRLQLSEREGPGFTLAAAMMPPRSAPPTPPSAP